MHRSTWRFRGSALEVELKIEDQVIDNMREVVGKGKLEKWKRAVLKHRLSSLYFYLLWKKSRPWGNSFLQQVTYLLLKLPVN